RRSATSYSRFRRPAGLLKRWPFDFAQARFSTHSTRACGPHSGQARGLRSRLNMTVRFVGLRPRQEMAIRLRSAQALRHAEEPALTLTPGVAKGNVSAAQDDGGARPTAHMCLCVHTASCMMVLNANV